VIDMGALVSKLGSINRLYRIIGYVILIIIIGALYYFMFYLPLEDELKNTKSEYERLTGEIERLKPKIKNYEQFKKELEILDKQFSMLLEILPNEKSYNLIYDQLVEIAEKNGLKVTLFQPTNETSIDDFHAKVNFNMNVEGKYHFVNFLYSISFINRVVNVNNFTVTPRKDSDGTVLISVSMSMNSYMFKQAQGKQTDNVTKKDTGAKK